MNQLIKAKIDAVASRQNFLFDNAGAHLEICRHHKHIGTVASRIAEPCTEA